MTASNYVLVSDALLEDRFVIIKWARPNFGRIVRAYTLSGRSISNDNTEKMYSYVLTMLIAYLYN